MLSVQGKECPLDYSLCNQTMTIYHQDAKRKTITRTVITGATFEYRKIKTLEKTGSKDANRFLLIIPQSSCHYIDAAVFENAPGTYTLSAFDKVFLGEGPIIGAAAEWSAFIPARVSGLALIKEIEPKYWQDKLCHVEAAG